MTTPGQIAVFLRQLIAWLSLHPETVRLGLIVVAVLAALVLSYSVTYAMPPGGGGGGCPGGC